MNISSHVMGLLFAAGALVSWTGVSFFIRLALKDAPLLKIAATTTTLNSLLVAGLVYYNLPLEALRPKLTQTWILLPITGLFMIGLSRLTYFYAIRSIGPSRTIPIAASTPAVTAILAAIALGEPITLRIVIGVCFLTAGITSVVRSEPSQDQGEKNTQSHFRGYVSAAATTLNWAATGVMLKVISKDIHPLGSAAWVIWIGLVFAWIISFSFGPRGERAKIPAQNWKWILCASICQTAAIPSFSNALARTHAVNVSSVTSLQPLLVILIAHLLLREAENITLKIVLGAGMTVCGTILVLL